MTGTGSKAEELADPDGSPLASMQSDAELMARVRAGERDAFALLVERYEGTIVNYLSKLTGQRARAEDLAQETFLRLFSHATRYREEGRLAAFLYRTATNLYRSEERHLFRWRWRWDSIAAGLEHERPRSQEEALLGREEERALRAALLCVPLHYRAPLVLHAIEERSFEEIAEVLRLPIGTVKSRISRGRVLLRDALTEGAPAGVWALPVNEP
jgi:RNA polymerase sigma-70 factor (ECF subfamily)